MKKIILFYYPSLRSSLIYQPFLRKYHHLISHVVEMPAIPYSRKAKKRNWGLLWKAITGPWQFFLMSAMTIKVYSLLARLFHTDIKALSKKLSIPYHFYEKIDQEMLQWLEKEKPSWIISSTSTLLTKNFLSKASCGVLNVHEAPLPSYKGSACYFWALANGEKSFHVTAMYVSVGLDEGDIITTGPKIPIDPSVSVFKLWKEQLLSYEKVWPQLIPYFEQATKAPCFAQGANNYTATSYPTKECIANIKKNGHKIIEIKDIIWILKKSISF